MGWKSTKTLNRSKSLSLINDDIIYNLTNDEISNALESLCYGEKTELKYYGCNFSIEDDKEDKISKYPWCKLKTLYIYFHII